MQGGVVPSLVKELRSHMPRSQKIKKMKQEQYCNRFSKDLKNGPHPKKEKYLKMIASNSGKDAMRRTLSYAVGGR